MHLVLIESNNELINEIFEDFDPTDDQKIRNRFSHLAYIMSLEESDNSSNSSNSQEEVFF